MLEKFKTLLIIIHLWCLPFCLSSYGQGQGSLDGFGAVEVNDDLSKERIWTSVQGTTLRAKLLRISKDKIVVRSIGISSDRELELPISNLSKMDRILLDRFQVKHLSPDKIDFSLFRFWTNSAGKEIEAKIHNASESSVQIIVKGGKLFRLSFDSLSESDRRYVQKYLLVKSSLSDDQILKRLTMYKWRNTPSGSWGFRLEFKSTKTANDWREVQWIWYRGGSRSGSWKLEPNGVIKTTFGYNWRFSLADEKHKVLKGIKSGYPTLYGSTGFD